MDKEFFLRDAEQVARELLGKILVRDINGRRMKARIVETEAYYDENDPASRACKNGDLRETMKMRAGTVLVYGCHNNWLLNFVNNKEGKAEAVLIRALQPLNFEGKCSGPGLLTRAMSIDKKFHKQNLFNNKLIWIEEGGKDFEVGKSFRIGVRKDLSRKLRFYIKGNKHISRK